ncbi:MAG: hypothetical protein IM638_01565 [Bacteroidetes bacterium]|nr:hypothetical protein [Bacteroidota bacterium]
MVDYIKLSITSKSLAHYLRTNVCHVLDNVLHRTGDISNSVYVGTIGNEFKVEVFSSNRVQLSGSLHKYYTQGTNAGDFTFSMVCDAVERLAGELGVYPYELILHNLEIGVNLSLPYSPDNVLKNIVCTKTGCQFNIHSTSVRYCPKGEYRHKIYNKSAQYPIKDKHILRYEIHIDKMRKIPPVKTLQDLTEMQNWFEFQRLLLLHFGEIVFLDYYDWEILPETERNFYKKHGSKINNILCWKRFKAKQRHDIFKQLKAFQIKYGANRFSFYLHSLIEKKIDELRVL